MISFLDHQQELRRKVLQNLDRRTEKETVGVKPGSEVVEREPDNTSWYEQDICGDVKIK